MATQMSRALKGEITPEMEAVAWREKVSPEHIRDEISKGRIVITANKNHVGLEPAGFGKGLKTKVNANIGTSTSYPNIEDEIKKLHTAIEAGADAVMDLSTGPDIDGCRKKIIKASNVAIGTVPIYQAVVETIEQKGNIISMTEEDLFKVIEKHAEDGVDFITVHCGITQEVISRLKNEGRITDIVSRGGSFITGWMLYHEKENPLFAQYDRLLDICFEYDVTLSLGDGLRPGCLADATDRAQVQELLTLGELVDRARKAGVQAMVEGPGHVPLDQIEANIKLQKRLCREAPFYVLGPLVTDIAPGYDHITAAIGGTIAAAAGADFLCYVTPAEHLGLPTIDDVREGVVASRIAGHAADIVKGVAGAKEMDAAMAKARKNLDWEKQIALAIDPVKAKKYRESRNQSAEEACSMCGNYCAMKVVSEFFAS